MTYFEFYDLPLSLKVDEAELKKIFYVKSKALHPDFHTDATEEEQEEMLRLSALNNQAYKTLKDFDKRMKYILDIKSIIKPEDKDDLPQEFLMEMMDINESIMELQFEFDKARYDTILADVKNFEKDMYTAIESVIEEPVPTDDQLHTVKHYYYKKKYLRRMLENLEKINEN